MKGQEAYFQQVPVPVISLLHLHGCYSVPHSWHLSHPLALARGAGSPLLMRPSYVWGTVKTVQHYPDTLHGIFLHLGQTLGHTEWQKKKREQEKKKRKDRKYGDNLRFCNFLLPKGSLVLSSSDCLLNSSLKILTKTAYSLRANPTVLL